MMEKNEMTHLEMFQTAITSKFALESGEVIGRTEGNGHTFLQYPLYTDDQEEFCIQTEFDQDGNFVQQKVL